MLKKLTTKLSTDTIFLENACLTSLTVILITIITVLLFQFPDKKFSAYTNNGLFEIKISRTFWKNKNYESLKKLLNENSNWNTTTPTSTKNLAEIGRITVEKDKVTITWENLFTHFKKISHKKVSFSNNDIMIQYIKKYL